MTSKLGGVSFFFLEYCLKNTYNREKIEKNRVQKLVDGYLNVISKDIQVSFEIYKVL
jgi:hypothetical protein